MITTEERESLIDNMLVTASRRTMFTAAEIIDFCLDLRHTESKDEEE